MPDIQNFIGMHELKGPSFNADKDNLHEIRNKTDIIRADSGELNGTAIIDMYITNDMTLTGNITVKNLYVLDGAILDGAFTLIVQEDCFVYSSRITGLTFLDVHGDLTIDRDVGDTSTQNQLIIDALDVKGNVSISRSVLNVPEITIGGNFDLDFTTFIQSSDSYSLYVGGNMTTTDLNVDNSVRWFVQGDLTTDALAGNIDVVAENFTYTGTVINATQDFSGLFAGDTGTSSNAPFTGGAGGEGAYLNICVKDTFTSSTLSNINITASNGQTQSQAGGGGGGGCFFNINAATSNLTNPVTLTATAGNGAGGGANYYCGSGGGGGGGVGKAADGGVGGGGSCAGGSGSNGSGGKGFTDTASTLCNVNITSVSNQPINVTLVPGSGGNGGTSATNAVGGSGGNGTVGITTDTDEEDLTVVKPNYPTLVTADNSTNPTTLEFTPPVHFENINFDFEIVIQKQYTEKIYKNAYIQNSNDDAGQFSGTPPYIQGGSNVSYTLPTLSASVYRWRVKTLKDADTANTSLYSPWRYFETN